MYDTEDDEMSRISKNIEKHVEDYMITDRDNLRWRVTAFPAIGDYNDVVIKLQNTEGFFPKTLAKNHVMIPSGDHVMVKNIQHYQERILQEKMPRTQETA